MSQTTMDEQEYEYRSALHTDDFPVTAGFYLMNRLDDVREILTDGDDDDPDRTTAQRAHAALLHELRRRLSIADRAEGRTPPEDTR